MGDALAKKMTAAEAVKRAKAKGLQGPVQGQPGEPVDKERLRELAAKLGRGKGQRLPTVWPGTEVPIEVEVLSMSEQLEAEAAAERYVRDLLGAEYLDLAQRQKALAARTAVEYLARALIDPEADGPMFASPDELASVAWESELEVLFESYRDHCDEVAPSLDELSDEEFETVEKAIKKKDVALLKDCVSSLPRSCLLTLVERLATSQMGRSSSGAS